MNTNSRDSEIKTYAKILWRWLWLLILFTMISGTLAYFLSSISTPVYRATTMLLIDNGSAIDSNPSVEVRRLDFIERLSQTWAQLMKSKSIMVKTADKLAIEPEILFNDIVSRQVTPIQDTQLMRIDIESVSPSLAALVANTMPAVFGEELINVQSARFEELKSNLQIELDDLEQEIQLKQIHVHELPESRTPQEDIEYMALQADISELQSDRRNIRNRLDEIRLTEVQSTDSIAVVEPAEIPLFPIRPRIFLNSLLATIVGAMVALAFVFAVEFLDDRIRSARDLQIASELPLFGAVGIIPIKGNEQQLGIPDESLITVREPRNPLSEAYRGIRTGLQFAGIDHAAKTLMVTSAMPGEGKSTTAANLAVVLAQSGFKVAIIDADMRKPNIHKIFRIASRPGIVDAILANENSPLRFSPERKIKNLRIMPVGKRPPNPAELLGSKRMKNLIERLKAEVDYIVMDAPPVLAVTDAQILGGLVDQVLLVVRHGTDRAAVVRALDSLRMVDAPVVGTVLNRIERSGDNDYYYYYGYYSEKEQEQPITPGPTVQIPIRQNGNGTVPKNSVRFQSFG